MSTTPDETAVAYHGGIEWPLFNEKSGRPSTTPTNKSVWIAALKALVDATSDDKHDSSSIASAEIIERAKKLLQNFQSQPSSEWRKGYIPLLEEFGKIMASCEPKGSLIMAHAGLDCLNSSMVISTSKGDEKVSAQDAVLKDGTVQLRSASTVTVAGGSSRDNKVPVMSKYELASPHCDKSGKNLIAKGEMMKSQLSKWAEYGCIEPSVAESASKIADLDDCHSSLVKDKVFVLLGATSAMGPAEVLIKLGATIAAVARPGKKLKALEEMVKAGPSEAEMLLPKLEGSDDPGADLIRDAPELARWIADLCPEKKLVICNLAYLDGEKNVLASVGMDLIIEHVCEKRQDTIVSYIISPATVHVVTEEAAQDAKRRYDSAPFWHSLCMVQASNIWRESTASGLRVFNGLSNVQGPNYALAKTTQQWRAMTLYGDEAKGVRHIVSANMGPPTRSESMVGHKTVAMALEGMQSFEPNIAFDVSISKTLLAALMLYDVNFDESAANPLSADKSVQHPMCLFNENSAHGGGWRCPYLTDSIGTASYLSGKVKSNGKWCPKESLGPRPDEA